VDYNVEDFVKPEDENSFEMKMILPSPTQDLKNTPIINTDTPNNNTAFKGESLRRMATGPTVSQDDNDNNDNKVISNFDNMNKDPNTWFAKAFTTPSITSLGYVCLVINKRLELKWDRMQEDKLYVTTSILAVFYIHKDIQVLKKELGSVEPTIIILKSNSSRKEYKNQICALDTLTSDQSKDSICDLLVRTNIQSPKAIVNLIKIERICCLCTPIILYVSF
jgi:hypothetical protein